MAKKKRPSHVQPSLFPTDEISAIQDNAPPDVEPLEPGDVVLVDGQRSPLWIVVREIADHVSIWNQSASDCVERSRVQRYGKMPGVLNGFASDWLGKLIHSLGYWEVLALLTARQPNQALETDQLPRFSVYVENCSANDLERLYQEAARFNDRLKYSAVSLDLYIENLTDDEAKEFSIICSGMVLDWQVG